MSDPVLTIIEAIRWRPAMYMGSTSIRGFNHLLRSIVRYSFDKLRAKQFTFRILGRTRGQIIISDLEMPFLDALAFDPFGDQSDEGTGFVEFAALNALSDSFVLEIGGPSGSSRTVSFERGSLISGEIIGVESQASNITFSFDLDTSIFLNDTYLNHYFFLDFLQTQSFLNKGRKIVFEFEDEGQISNVNYNFPDGLSDLLEIKRLGSIFDGFYYPTHIEMRSAEFEAEIAFSFWQNPTNLPFQISFVSEQISPEDGVHLEAVLDGVRSTLNDYIRRNFSESELDAITTRAIRRALNCAVHIRMKRPYFKGSHRGKLLSPEIVAPIRAAVSAKLASELNEDRILANEVVTYLSRSPTLNAR